MEYATPPVLESPPMARDDKRIQALERSVAELQETVADIATRVGDIYDDGAAPPSIRDMLKLWPGGLYRLAEELEAAPASLDRFIHARKASFPVALAADCVGLFARHDLEVFGEPLTVERLRRAWVRARREKE